jgi:transcriptional regulator with XRE-family HTH domain
MAMSELHRWVNETPQRKRTYAQESLIVDVSEEIWEALEQSGLTKSELADRLGSSKSHITQLLNGARNMTLRSLSDIAHALGREVRVKLLLPHEVSVWQNTPMIMLRSREIETDAVEFLCSNEDTVEELEQSAA